MKVNKQDPTSPRSMDFQPYSDWNIPSKAGCTSGLWQFVQFDTKSVPSPTPPPNPPNIIRQVLKFPKKARNQFWVGDCEQETRAPLSSMCCNIQSKQDIPNGRTPKVQEPKRKFLNGKLRNLFSRPWSNWCAKFEICPKTKLLHAHAYVEFRPRPRDLRPRF
jgi:hypothetical protein